MTTRLERDAETIELHADFLQESADGLTQVEELLAQPANADAIAAMFRVFHTIKGVAGLLELAQLVRLAHTVETLLNQYREGSKTLDVDLMFEAVAMHRKMLAEVKRAVEASVAIEAVPAVEPYVERVLLEIRRSQPTPVAKEVTEAPVTEAVATLKETLKVDLERIDTLVEMVGELLVTQAMVANAPEMLGLMSPGLRRNVEQLTKVCRHLHELAMRLRMVPVRGLFQKAVRIVHELSRKTGKDVVLERDGDEVELDRGVVDRLEEPLVHMLRNAIDHGVEEKGARVAAGKPSRATVRLKAFHESGRVVIEISDDGRGLNREAILRRATERGLIAPNAELTEQELWGLIFLPGFSTAEKVSELSGRGVGMDVVMKQVQAMHGRVAVTSQAGQGTTVRLSLPLTLAVINGMLVSCGDERYIIPSLAIVESLRPEPSMWATAGQKAELLNLRGELVSVVRLGRLLGSEAETAAAPDSNLAVVVEGQGRKVALMVRDVLAEQQIVIKPLATMAQAADLFSGVAILPDGRAGLILDVDRVVGSASVTRGEPRA